MFYLVHPRRWLYTALISALGLLAAAHAFETFGHLAPCELCLGQRDVYWTAAGVALAAVIAQRLVPPDRIVRLACTVLGVIFLGEAGLAAYHAGVEWKWWPGPAACTGAGVAHVSLSDLKAFTSGARYNVVRCDEAAWRFLGLSMAGWNVLIALKLSILSLVSSRR